MKRARTKEKIDASKKFCLNKTPNMKIFIYFFTIYIEEVVNLKQRRDFILFPK